MRSLSQYLLFLLLFFSCQNSINKEVIESDEQKISLIKGAFFQGSNGVYFDDQDRLYVTSVVSRLIGVVDTDTGEIIDTLSQAEGVEGPDDLIFGPDG